GLSLSDLIADAVRRGYRAVELRQTCLGDLETGDDHLPLAEELSELPNIFPGMRFNLAISVPCLQPGFSACDRVFTAGKWAAQAVAGEYPPHLRLVDLQTTAAQLSATTPVDTGRAIAQLARALVELDGVLSLEHARQPWRDFRAAFDAARDHLARDADRLRLCYDPCNLLLGGDGVDPAMVTASLSADELSMVHVKQREGDSGLAVVTDGDVDWAEQAVALTNIEYRGPILFEVEPHEDIWQNLDASCRYLQRAGFGINRDALERD
ncbi:MAG: sugar phosphate isomerase/epimerase, partial [Proteobacteria bacterium]|nr:sugar phosphate isomerase/epimerase [Pseudomonadota bacterium]